MWRSLGLPCFQVSEGDFKIIEDILRWKIYI